MKKYCLNFFLYIIIFNLIFIQNGSCDNCDLDDIYLHLFGKIENVKQSLEIINIRLDVLADRSNINIDLNKSLEKHKENPNKLTKPIVDIRYDSLSKQCPQNFQPNSCAEATACTHSSGIYNITDTRYSKRSFAVYCDHESYEGDWLYILRRNDGSENFNRSWSDYVNGFGNVAGEYWIGLENLYALTNFYGPQELNVFIENFEGEKKFARYDNFAIGNATQNYKLKSLGRYTGTAGDSLYNHLGSEFSTIDVDNDQSRGSCALISNGGFWFKSCGYANPTGSYLRGTNSNLQNNSHWYTFGGYFYSHKTIIFMIRRQNSSKLE